MKKLLTILAVCVFAFAVTAADEANDAKMEQLKTQVQEKVCADLEDLDEAVKAQVQEAKKDAEAVQAQLKTMSKAEEDGEMKKLQTQAQEQLEEAIAKMEQLKNQVQEATEEIQKQLQKREGELKQVKDGECTSEKKSGNE